MSTNNLGPFNTGSALNVLFDHCKSNLTQQELKYLARASDHAEEQADNMAAIINDLALLITHENGGKEVGIDDTIPKLLWQTGNIFEEIAGLMRLANQARFLLKNQDSESPKTRAK